MKFTSYRQSRWIACFVAAAVFVVSARQSFAGFQPSFGPEFAAWNATDIVVVEQQKKGVVVREVWKGGLPKGAALDIQDLPKPPVEVAMWNDEHPVHKTVGGKRIILFLKKAPKANPADSDHWIGACDADETWSSAVWIDGGQTYAFSQAINPGPSELWSLDSDETAFKKQMNGFLADSQSFNQAIAVADPAKRAKLLLPMAAQSDDDYRKEMAIPALGDCGLAAVPMIRQLIGEYKLHTDMLTEALCHAAGQNAGAVMTELLKDEVAFWQKEAPALPANWSAEPEPEADRWRTDGNRESIFRPALHAIDIAHYVPARQTIEAVRDLWKSSPQLRDYDDSIIPECAEMLDRLDKPATQP